MAVKPILSNPDSVILKEISGLIGICLEYGRFLSRERAGRQETGYAVWYPVSAVPGRGELSHLRRIGKPGRIVCGRVATVESSSPRTIGPGALRLTVSAALWHNLSQIVGTTVLFTLPSLSNRLTRLQSRSGAERLFY